MRIALDQTPLSIHKGRGIGYYTKQLSDALKKKVEIVGFTGKPPGNIDLIHYPGFTLFTKPSKIPQQPFVVTVHDLIPLEYPNQFPLGIKAKLLWQLQKIWLKKASLIITDSKVSQKSIHKYTGIELSKIQVIPLAASSKFTTLNNQSRLKTVQKKLKLPNKFVLYVGDLNWNKNMVALTKTCLELNYPQVIVGQQAINQDYDHSHPENQAQKRFQSLASSNPTKIIRLGFVSTSDLVSIYNLATIYAHPSIAEGFGLPILEAFSCGCPVITSKSTSTHEIAGKAALLINPLSQTELSQALKKLWTKPTLRNQLSKLGLIQAQQFTWPKVIKETINVYEKALKTT